MGIITLSVVSANTPNICNIPRDSLTKSRIEPNKRHSADPRADLQRFSSLKAALVDAWMASRRTFSAEPILSPARRPSSVRYSRVRINGISVLPP